MSAGSLTQLVFVEQLDLLVAKPVDVEGAARDEMLEMLDRLIGAGELAGAMDARAFVAAGDDLAHHVGMQRARAIFREFVGLGAARTFVQRRRRAPAG